MTEDEIQDALGNAWSESLSKRLNGSDRQTWSWVPRRGPLRMLIQAIHGLWGHEPSKTEFGYSGGDTVDCWCKWCDKHFTVPMETGRFYFPQLAQLKPIIKRVKRNAGIA